jgi:hypothetical protein
MAADDGSIEMEGAERALVAGVAEGEHAPVGGKEPVSLIVRGDGGGHGRGSEGKPGDRTDRGGVSVVEDPSVGQDEYVAAPVGGDRGRHHRRGQAHR